MITAEKNWSQSLRVYLDRRILSMVFLGFSSGVPFGVLAEPLTAWLFDSGVDKTAIGLFALVSLPYSLKFLWAPIMDHMKIPVISRVFGRRRGWVLVTQIALLISILGLGYSDPAGNLIIVAVFAMIVAFMSASQDVVIDAYRVEILEEAHLGAGAAMMVFGWRFGQVGGAAAGLFFADIFPWSIVFFGMGFLIVIGMITILVNPEPRVSPPILFSELEGQISEFLQSRKYFFPLPLKTATWLYGALICPFLDFMSKDRWLAILMFVMFYKLGDGILAVMKIPFFLEIGFTKTEIAGVAKVFGFNAIIFGGFIGGILLIRIGIMRGLLVCGLLMGLSNLIFVAQAWSGSNLNMLAVTIAVENITTGMGTAAFVAYLSSLCNVAYTATQYALLTSLMAFTRTMVSSGAGWLADQLNWIPFFILTTLSAVPGLIILAYLIKTASLEKSN